MFKLILSVLSITCPATFGAPPAAPTPPSAAQRPGGTVEMASRSCFPTFRWGKPARYFHSQNLDGTFSEEEIGFIATNYDFVCIEKSHGIKRFGESQTAFTLDAKRIREKNPTLKVLFYVNTILNYHCFKERAVLAQHPEWLVKDAQDNTIKKLGDGPAYLDVRQLPVREWLTDIGAAMCASGGADGLFLDGSSQATGRDMQKYFTAAQLTEFREGMLALYSMFRAKLGPNKLMVLNGADAGEETSDVAQYATLCDGVYMETFLGAPHRSKEVTAAHIETIDRLGRQGKIIIAKGWPDDFTVCRQQYPEKAQEEKEACARKGIAYPLACFLMGARDYAYFAYSWWYDQNDGWFLDYPELGTALGRPLGDCTRNGWKYTREFEHATISADVEKQTAVITPKQKQAK